jgi:hypothetical protein
VPSTSLAMGNVLVGRDVWLPADATVNTNSAFYKCGE